MESLEINHWSTVINIILQTYFSQLTTTCILWPSDFDFNLRPASDNHVVYLQISPLKLNESFAKDNYNFTAQQENFNNNGVYYNDLIKKMIAAIEQTNCEGFLAFQDDIPLFAEAFNKASSYSLWRSINNRFLFVYNKAQQKYNYFQHIFFKNQPNICIIEADFMNSSVFSLKTNKFVGSTYEQPEKLVNLTTFNALTNAFNPDIDLFSLDKLRNLQGREIVVGTFDYRPFVAVDYNRMPQYYDHAEYNSRHSVHVDGTEMRICHTFCEIYNCTVQFVTLEHENWGSFFANYSGEDGLLGMLSNDEIQMAIVSFYTWYDVYKVLDMTTFLGQSGITCLVPKPIPLVSWTLPLKPFKFTLWMCVLFYIFLETVSLLMARYFEQYLEERNDNSWWSCLKFGAASSFKILISQSTSYKVNSNALRTLLLSIYMMDIIITSIYGGGLAATLTLPNFEEAADSVHKLYTHNLKWAGSTPAWVEYITLDEIEDLEFKEVILNFLVITKEEMREKAKSDNMGFVVERLLFGHFANSEFITPQALEHIKLMIDDIYNTLTVAMVARLWAHLPKYNDLILAWHSSGFSKFWEWKITAEYLDVQLQNQVEASRYLSNDNGPIKLDMKNFGGLILIWFLGMIISIVVFVAELLVFKRKKNIQVGKLS